ncbi:hypothetical protein CWE34_26560 [Bacillus sp. SN10]|nr:hypothetical protein CWE34_26560 [Bacillus sp. SN10]
MDTNEFRYVMHKRRSFFWFERYRSYRNIARLTGSDYDYSLMKRAYRMYKMNREYADKYRRLLG